MGLGRGKEKGKGKGKGVKQKWVRSAVRVRRWRALSMGLNSRSCQTFDLTLHSGISKQVKRQKGDKILIIKIE